MSANEEAIEIKDSRVFIDPLLQILVKMANDTTDGDVPLFWITIYTNGVVISGQLVSKKYYLKSFAQTLANGLDNEAREIIINTFRPSDDTEENISTEKLPNLIHLRGAQIISASGCIPTVDGIMWRGKLEDISGFNLGKFAPPQ